jgi:hypothetical protein
MASSRNKNTFGNYNAQQLDYKRSFDNRTYIHGPNGIPIKTYFPGNGLLAGKSPLTELSYDQGTSRDIESFLYGINSTNLVNPRENITFQLKKIPTLDLYETPKTIMPEPLVVENNQRPSLW